MTLSLELVAVAALVLLNGFFVAAEYALVTVRRTRLQELSDEGNRRAKQVLGLTAVPPRFIAAMQLGVTVTSLAIGALGEQALTELFDPVMATALAVALSLLLLTFFHVVVGELVPKGISLGHSERTRAARRAPGAPVLLRLQAADLVPAEIERRDAAAAGAGAAGRRRGGLLGGRAEAPARTLDGRGRARGGGAGDALQGLRLRGQGGRAT